MTVEELEQALLRLDALLREHGVRDNRVQHAAGALQDGLPDGLVLTYDPDTNEYKIGSA